MRRSSPSGQSGRPDGLTQSRAAPAKPVVACARALGPRERAAMSRHARARSRKVLHLAAWAWLGRMPGRPGPAGGRPSGVGPRHGAN
jgi:hypothetical protein